MHLSTINGSNAVHFGVAFARKNGYSFVSLRFQKNISRYKFKKTYS
jgi:hypothetical protein